MSFGLFIRSTSMRRASWHSGARRFWLGRSFAEKQGAIGITRSFIASKPIPHPVRRSTLTWLWCSKRQRYAAIHSIEPRSLLFAGRSKSLELLVSCSTSGSIFWQSSSSVVLRVIAGGAVCSYPRLTPCFRSDLAKLSHGSARLAELKRAALSDVCLSERGGTQENRPQAEVQPFKLYGRRPPFAAVGSQTAPRSIAIVGVRDAD